MRTDPKLLEGGGEEEAESTRAKNQAAGLQIQNTKMLIMTHG